MVQGKARAAKVRRPAVAGSFYPADPGELDALIVRYLAQAGDPPEAPPPKALIVPHAGYIYSGPVAASAYSEVCRRWGGWCFWAPPTGWRWRGSR
jgi:AmmeMemoRadiSam system protein B